MNYGTHLIVKCDRAAGQRQVVGAVMLGLHVVEVLDAISVLIRKCCVDPAKTLLRSQMEAMFGIAYMAQADSERRATQYVVAHAHWRIDWYKKLDPAVEIGKKLRAQLKKDSTFHELDIVALDTTGNIQNLETMLARPEYSIVEADWQRLRQQKSGQIWWYSLNGGPRNIGELAAAVGDSGWYEVLFRLYSGEIHATNALSSLHRSHDKGGAYQPLRYPTDLPMVTMNAVSMTLRTYRSLIDRLIPAERDEYAKWFAKEIKPTYNELAQFKIVDPSRPSKTPPRRSS
ncbi:MAG: DUF5677 domain-containing protein [Candidatus Sulfotelmatobacter sp.]